MNENHVCPGLGFCTHVESEVLSRLDRVSNRRTYQRRVFRHIDMKFATCCDRKHRTEKSAINCTLNPTI